MARTTSPPYVCYRAHRHALRNGAQDLKLLSIRVKRCNCNWALVVRRMRSRVLRKAKTTVRASTDPPGACLTSSLSLCARRTAHSHHAALRARSFSFRLSTMQTTTRPLTATAFSQPRPSTLSPLRYHAHCPLPAHSCALSPPLRPRPQHSLAAVAHFARPPQLPSSQRRLLASSSAVTAPRTRHHSSSTPLTDTLDTRHSWTRSLLTAHPASSRI